MTGYSLIREPRGPHWAWLVVAALCVVLILPDFGIRHRTIEWVKAQIDWFDTTPANQPLPPTADLPHAKEAFSVGKPQADAPNLVVKVDGDSACLIHIMLNGRGPFPFVIDTGSPKVVLTRAQGKRLGFDLSRLAPDHGSGGWGGGRTNGIFRHVELQLNDLRLSDFEVAIEDETKFTEGLAGISFVTKLRRFEVAGGQCRLWW